MPIPRDYFTHLNVQNSFLKFLPEVCWRNMFSCQVLCFANLNRFKAVFLGILRDILNYLTFILPCKFQSKKNTLNFFFKKNIKVINTWIYKFIFLLNSMKINYKNYFNIKITPQHFLQLPTPSHHVNNIKI